LSAFIYAQTREFVVFVIDSGKLNDLARTVLVERQTSARIHHFALFVLSSAKYQTAVL